MRPKQIQDLTGVYAMMRRRNRLSPVIESRKEVEVDSKVTLISAERMEYADTNIVYPREIKKSAGEEFRSSVIYEYDDAYHLIYEYESNGLARNYQWAKPWRGAKNLRLVAVAESAGSPMGLKISRASADAPVVDEDLYSYIEQMEHEYFEGAPCKVLLIRYDDTGNVESIQDSRGVRKYFKYDIMGRVITVGDHHNRISELFNYNYPE